MKRKLSSSLYKIWNKNGTSSFSVAFIPIPSTLSKFLEKRWIGHFKPTMNTNYVDDKEYITFPKGTLKSKCPSTKLHPIICKRVKQTQSCDVSNTHVASFNPLYNTFYYPHYFERLSSATVFKLEGFETTYFDLDLLLQHLALSNNSLSYIHIRHGKVMCFNPHRISHKYSYSSILGIFSGDDKVSSLSHYYPE